MVLYIDTTLDNKIKFVVKEKEKTIIENSIPTNRDQAEKLLPGIKQALKKAKVNLDAIKKIVVNNRGGTFTSLRIGVVTANALGYALGVPVEAEDQGKANKSNNLYIVKPEYSKEPNITRKDNKTASK